MNIDDRKKKILQAIIDDYIDTAEPVGSRAIVKKHGLNLSPATIRNEMADLEDMGYLKQPHTSAGRVPSLLGYRLYVDELMTQYSLTMEEIATLRSALEMKIDYLDKIIARTSQIMSELTNYTAVVSAPTIKTGSVKQIRLIYLDDYRLLAVVITNSGQVKDKKIRVEFLCSEEVLSVLERSINRHVAGMDFSKLTMDNVYEIAQECNMDADDLAPIFDFLHECVSLSDDAEVYVDGSTNILNFPEYADVEKAKRFLEFVGNRKDVMKVISEINQNEDGIHIQIGRESPDSDAADYSIITSKYKIGEDMEGVIGIIGPVRMDYKKAVSVLKHMTGMMSSGLLQITGEEEKKDGKERKET